MESTSEDRKKRPCPPGFNYPREILLTRITIFLTFIAWALATRETFAILWTRIGEGHLGATLAQVLFIAIINLLIYGNFVYQFTRLGYLKRRLAHQPATREQMEAVYDGSAPQLTVLVPSYKEELDVVMGTLLSAALQDYPNRRVVLLIDDPHNPKDPHDQAALEAMRQLPAQIQATLGAAAARFQHAEQAYLERRRSGQIKLGSETARVAGLYRAAAAWFDERAATYPVADHAGALLVDKILKGWSQILGERAAELEQVAFSAELSATRLRREYRRLAALFDVELTSFERKRYVNLSHEPNKAMNLNSYIGLIGKDYREVARNDGLHLEEAFPEQAELRIPDAEFILTLDADSVILPDYALRLIHLMDQPANRRIAVAQTPYSAIPGAPGLLERIAGATTDIQYLIHQGFTQHHATFWVGANALLRVQALNEIRTIERERGFEVAKFIQDRTVIEDTESSVDLVDRGWQLFNYPERLAYSATPPDFGSLLIQRRRWANGGLIILPKLMRYLVRGKPNGAKLAEGFFRLHYLGSIAVVNVGLLIVLVLPFEHSVESAWLPLTALPYFFLYTRDLIYCGYRASDMVRVYALNLLLILINLGGVLKSLHQAYTGQQIPFGRTPKVTGRTAAPPLYVAVEYLLLFQWLLGSVVDSLHGRWVHACFSIANAALLGYAVIRFIGLQESKEDLLLGLQGATQPAPAQGGELPEPALASIAVAARGAAVVWLTTASGALHREYNAAGKHQEGLALETAA